MSGSAWDQPKKPTEATVLIQRNGGGGTLDVPTDMPKKPKLPPPIPKPGDRTRAVSINNAVVEYAEVDRATFVGDPLAKHATFWELLVKVVRTAWPIMCTSSLDILPGFIGLAMVGHCSTPTMTSAAELSALGAGRMFYNFAFLAPIAGLTTGLQTQAPQAVGAGVAKEQHPTQFQTALVTIFLICIPCYFFMIFSEPLLLMFGQEPQIAATSSAVAIRHFPAGFVTCTNVLLYCIAQSLDLQWETFACSLIQIVGAVVVLPMFVLWFNMGYLGVGYAYTLYLMMGVVYMMYVFWKHGRFNLFVFVGCECGHNPGHTAAQRMAGRTNISAKRIKDFAKLALPNMLQMCLQWLFLEGVLLGSGVTVGNNTTSVAASVIILQMQQTLFTMFQSCAAAAAVNVGMYIGAASASLDDEAESAYHIGSAKTVAVVTSLLAGTASALVSVIIWIFRVETIQIFSKDPDVIALSAQLMGVFALMQPLEAVNGVLGGCLRALGKPGTSAVAQLCGYYLVGAPVAFVTVVIMKSPNGTMWLWASVLFADIVALSINMYAVVVSADWKAATFDAKERLRQPSIFAC